MPAAKTETSHTQILDEAAEAYFQTMKTGLRLQEEFAARWSKTLRDSMNAGTMWEQMQETMNKATMQARDNTAQILKMLEHSSRDGSDLINKAFDAARVTTPIEAQYKLQQLWEASLKALNSNAQIMVQTNAKLMQDWLEFMKKNIDGAAKASAASASK
jgi:signal transduction histidine kinase